MCWVQDYDDADERITIASVSIQKLGAALIQASFPSECHINLDRNGCIPIFALYRVRIYLLVCFLLRCIGRILRMAYEVILRQTGRINRSDRFLFCVSCGEL